MREYEPDFREYQTPETVRRYRRATAGRGINYLLRTTYGPIFIDSASAVRAETRVSSLRLIEFGCGAGMAVHHLTECLGEKGIDVELAVGADFVPAMIDAARLDLSEYGTPWARERVRYGVATNENLVAGVAEALGVLPKDISGTFHLALGVNTFRYPIRHGTSGESIEQLRTLLAPGGRVVVIDMNDRFPYALKPRRRTRHGSRLFPISLGSSNLPSLDEYARPFVEAGFEILRKDYLAWIPHSANGFRFLTARAASGILDQLAPTRAMRSIIIARKPG